jgi:hypothetical protein
MALPLDIHIIYKAAVLYMLRVTQKLHLLALGLDSNLIKSQP